MTQFICRPGYAPGAPDRVGQALDLRRHGRWLLPLIVAVVALGEQHWHLGERSWHARAFPSTVVRVEGELVQYEWRIHLDPALWANERPLPQVTDTARVYRFFPPYLHALGWALTGNVIAGLILVTDLFWVTAALCAYALGRLATGSAGAGFLAGVLAATSPGFLALQWHVPHLGAFALGPVFWLLVERARPYRADSPPQHAAVAGLLLGVGSQTYALHAPLLAWLAVVELPVSLRQRRRAAALRRWAVTLACFGAIYYGWTWLVEHVLFTQVASLNVALPLVRDALDSLRAEGPLRFALDRAAVAVRIVGQMLTWPVATAAPLGLVGLPRRWALRSAALATVFVGAAVVTAGQARVAYPAAAAGLVLAAGGVLWLGRAAARRLEQWAGTSIYPPAVQAALATLLVAWAWLLTHRELWGDYSVVRSW